MLRDKQLFEISEVEIMRVNCMCRQIFWVGMLKKVKVIISEDELVYNLLSNLHKANFFSLEVVPQADKIKIGRNKY